MKLNRYEKKIIKEIVKSRKGIYETPKRIREQYYLFKFNNVPRLDLLGIFKFG